MKKLARIVAGSTLLIFSSLAFAEGEPNLLSAGDNALLAPMSVFYIVVDDEVEDGCLPRPSALKDKMEVSIRQSGFGIVEKSTMFSNNIRISLSGYAYAGGCVVTLGTEIISGVPAVVYRTASEHTFANHITFIGRSLLTGSKSGMQSRLEKIVSEDGDRIYLIISRARDHMRKNFPELVKVWEE